MKKAYFLEIAKEAILSSFKGKKIDRVLLFQEYPDLKKEGAVFVTLRLNDELRGCMGSIVAHRSLLDDLIENARAAAFKDPRFVPLREEEYTKIELEVSLLSTPKELDYKDAKDLKEKIEPNKDGVILKFQNQQVTFLPQVWEQLPKFELFFEHLCKKAGLESLGCLDKHPTILIYQVEKVA